VRRLLKIFDRISEISAKIAMWGLCIVTGIVIYEVLTRRVFHSPHVWTYEIITFFYGAHFMLLAAYTLLKHGHVAIDIIYNRLQPRTQAILDLITYLIFFFPFLIVLFYVGASLAAASWATSEKTLTARLPVVLPAMKTVTPVTAALLLIQGFSLFYRRLYFLVRGENFNV
jgi:TRAP-type mannitol/chloroaromatic compound transport system permease small subunit